MPDVQCFGSRLIPYTDGQFFPLLFAINNSEEPMRSGEEKDKEQGWAVLSNITYAFAAVS